MICRHCGVPIHRDPAEPETGRWVHADSLRARCRDNRAEAEPRDR